MVLAGGLRERKAVGVGAAWAPAASVAAASAVVVSAVAGFAGDVHLGAAKAKAKKPAVLEECVCLTSFGNIRLEIRILRCS